MINYKILSIRQTPRDLIQFKLRQRKFNSKEIEKLFQNKFRPSELKVMILIFLEELKNKTITPENAQFGILSSLKTFFDLKLSKKEYFVFLRLLTQQDQFKELANIHNIMLFKSLEKVLLLSKELSSNPRRKVKKSSSLDIFSQLYPLYFILSYTHLKQLSIDLTYTQKSKITKFDHDININTLLTRMKTLKDHPDFSNMAKHSMPVNINSETNLKRVRCTLAKYYTPERPLPFNQKTPLSFDEFGI